MIPIRTSLLLLVTLLPAAAVGQPRSLHQPLCWITNAFDRSPAELLWTPQNAWGPLGGSLLNLSYGYGKIVVAPHEGTLNGKLGGMCELPSGALPTGVMRGRFSPYDKHLYTCGMFAWAGSAIQPGGLYRVRSTGQPMHLPTQIAARPERMTIAFTDAIAPETVGNLDNVIVRVWDLQRTKGYGSRHYNEQTLKVTAAELDSSGKSLTLHLPDLQPTWCMEIICRLTGADGRRIERVIHNSVFNIGE